MKKYPIKEFLKKNSQLLTATEEQKSRIFKYRDVIHSRIIEEIRKYYEKVINGDYHHDGMPDIKRGIRGWIEAKIWCLLVEIGEPDQSQYHHNSEDYWTEPK